MKARKQHWSLDEPHWNTCSCWIQLGTTLTMAAMVPPSGSYHCLSIVEEHCDAEQIALLYLFLYEGKVPVGHIKFANSPDVETMHLKQARLAMSC